MAQTLKAFGSAGSSLLQVSNAFKTTVYAELQESHLVYRCNSTMPSFHAELASNASKFSLRKPEFKLNWTGNLSGCGTPELWTKINRRSRHEGRAVVSASLAGPGTVEVAASIFQLATAFVVPFYTVMILAPKWIWTRKLMESQLTYFILGAAYIYLLCLSWTPETLGLMFSSKYWLPELSGITSMFASTLTVASAWLHLLAADLFAGRQVFLDGVEHNVETRHSLVLCLMMCPIGIFCHMITKSVTLIWRSRKPVDVEATNDISSY